MEKRLDLHIFIKLFAVLVTALAAVFALFTLFARGLYTPYDAANYILLFLSLAAMNTALKRDFSSYKTPLLCALAGVTLYLACRLVFGLSVIYIEKHFLSGDALSGAVLFSALFISLFTAALSFIRFIIKKREY